MYTWRVITWHIDLPRRGNSKHESRRRQMRIKGFLQLLDAVALFVVTVPMGRNSKGSPHSSIPVFAL